MNMDQALMDFADTASETGADFKAFAIDLYTFFLLNGTVLRYCSGDRSIFLSKQRIVSKLAGSQTIPVPATWYALNGAHPDVPAIKRSNVKSSIGFSVDDLTIEIAATPLVMIDGTEMLAAFNRGDFDGADVLVERLIQPTPGDNSLGTYIVFAGEMGDIDEITNVGAKMSIKAYTTILSNPMPAKLYQPSCRHSLFDVGCTLNAADFTTSGVVGAGATILSIPTNLTQLGSANPPAAGVSLSSAGGQGSNIPAQTYYVTVTYVTAIGESTESPPTALNISANRLLVVNSPPPAPAVIGYNVYVGLQPGGGQLQNGTPVAIGTSWTMLPGGYLQGAPPPIVTTNGYFTQGVITFTSGLNQGLSRYVLNYANGGLVTILDALEQPPSEGDTFTIVPGCDKSMPTCQGKFTNLINFGGQPFVPQPEAVI